MSPPPEQAQVPASNAAQRASPRLPECRIGLTHLPFEISRREVITQASGPGNAPGVRSLRYEYASVTIALPSSSTRSGTHLDGAAQGTPPPFQLGRIQA